MAKKPDDDSGGAVESVSSRVSLANYLNTGDDAVLLGRVDFLAMIEAFLKSIILAITLSWSAAVLGFQRAFDLVSDAIVFTQRTVIGGVFAAGGEMIAIATRSAAGELEVFGLFALPVSVVVGLSSLLAISLVVYIFFGDEVY